MTQSEMIAKARTQLKSGDISYEDVQEILKFAFEAGFSAGCVVGKGDVSIGPEKAWLAFRQFAAVLYHANSETQE